MPNNKSKQSDTEEDLVKKLEIYKDEAKAYKSQFETEWRECESFYAGKHWKLATERPYKNFCFSIVESEIPILTDSRPSSDFIPYEQEDTEKAKVLESAVHYVYDEQNLQLKLAHGVRSALKSGNGFLYVDWNPNEEFGEGQVTIKNTKWDFVSFDPMASEIDECRYVLIETPTKLEEVKRVFPKAKDLEAELLTTRQYGEMRSAGTASDRWSPSEGSDSGVRRKYELDDVVTVEEYWHKDYSMVEIPTEETEAEIIKEHGQFESEIIPDISKYENHDEHIQAHIAKKILLASELLNIEPAEVQDFDLENLKSDPKFGVIFSIIDDHIKMHEILKDQNPDGKKPKFKNNLRLTVKVGGTILYDGSTPSDIGIVPLIPIYCYKEEDCIYGFGEIKNLLPIQKAINEMDWAELQGLRLNGNSGWVVDAESGVKPENLTNEPGIVLKKKQGTEVQRLPPGQVSPQITDRKAMDRQEMEIISGINEASQGRRPRGIEAASAIKYLQEQSIGRIRLKTRMLEEYSLLRLGYVVAGYISKFWTTERKLRAYDSNGQIKYINFNPEFVRDLKYQIKIAPGSSVGIDKETIFILMQNLLQQGMITTEDFFEVVDVPNRAHILKKIQERNEMKLMLEQLTMENEELKTQLDQVMGIAESGMPMPQETQGQTM